MNGFSLLRFSMARCRFLRAILCFFWIFGMIAGAYSALSAGATLFSEVLSAVSYSVFGMLTALLLPILISILALSTSNYFLFMPLAFLKAFSYSYVGVGLVLAFESAGWLIRLFLMFADTLLLPLLWILWLHPASFGKIKTYVLCAVSGCLAVLICCFDYYIVAPFLAYLI